MNIAGSWEVFADVHPANVRPADFAVFGKL
jgi:hypothetical protein